MYGTSSPRATRHEYNMSSGSPTKANMILRTSHSAILSPGRSRRRASSGSGGNRSNSPLSLTGEGSGGSQNLSYGISPQNLSVDNYSVGRSSFHSPAHSRSSSTTSVKSLLRDRSLDRNDHDHTFPERHGSLVRDRSLDRQLDRHHRDMDRIHTNFHPNHALRDRALEKDYPHMGARSLDRTALHQDHMRTNLVRSRSIDHEYLANQASFMPPTQDLRLVRDSYVLELQTQIAELNKECSTLLQEVDLTREKLSSSMNSIKTFWSPELKKERALRKEESGKMSSVVDQIRVTLAENQRLVEAAKELEEEVHCLRSGQPSPITTLSSSLLENSTSPGSPKSVNSLRRDKEKSLKEIKLLKKTVEQMEIRIDTQKQTLTARDESIKKLMEMLQSKGLAVKQLEDEDKAELERMRIKIAESDRKVMKLESILENRDKQVSDLKQSLSTSSLLVNGERPSTTEGLHALLESKENKVQALEREVKVLEEELLNLREESVNFDRMPSDNRIELETLKSQERLAKIKLENARAETQQKETELIGLKTKMESQDHHTEDLKRHIEVLKEQVSAKDQQMTMMQSDVDLLRKKIEERERQIEKKNTQHSGLQLEKRQLENDLRELHDHMDIKERKINVLVRKMDHFEELMNEKDSELESLKSRLRLISADQSSSNSALSGLEDSITEKERMIERLKEQRNSAEVEHQAEIETYQENQKEYKLRIDDLQAALDEKQHEILELREKSATLRSDRSKKDSQMTKLELLISQKEEKINDLSQEIKRMVEENKVTASQNAADTSLKLSNLESASKRHKEQLHQAQAEVDRLLDLLKQTEDEKHKKDAQIKELQDSLKESRSKLGVLKREQASEKNKNAQLLEEARKRENRAVDDHSQLKSNAKESEDRIEELEEALRESVKITAQREVVMAQQKEQLENLRKQVKSLVEEIEGHKQSAERLTSELKDKQSSLKIMQTERKQNLQEGYDMKQEAILAAISERDAHIALLESSSQTANSKEIQRVNTEKVKLQLQLKELTEQMMTLMMSNDDAENKNISTDNLQNKTS